MSKTPKLILEVLSGPLDGATIELDEHAEWTRDNGSPLSFPWDDELDAPQAGFIISPDGWQLEVRGKTRHGTHLFRRDAEDRLPVTLEPDDIIKASRTWLLVQTISD